MTTVSTKPTAEEISQARDYLINVIANKTYAELTSPSGAGQLMSNLINGSVGINEMSNQDLLRCVLLKIVARKTFDNLTSPDGAEQLKSSILNGAMGFKEMTIKDLLRSAAEPSSAEQAGEDGGGNGSGSGDPLLDAAFVVLAYVADEEIRLIEEITSKRASMRTAKLEGKVSRVSINHEKHSVTFALEGNKTVYRLKYSKYLGRAEAQALDLSQAGDIVEVVFYAESGRDGDGDLTLWKNKTLGFAAESPGDML